MKNDNGKTDANFVDHYEVLQVSQGADAETVERVYRLLAKRYHPDNTSSGDEARFCAVREAFEVLSDPERRARFDVRYDDQTGARWRIFSQEEALNDHQRDQRIFHGVLSLLYAARRRDPQTGGLGAMHLEETLGVPREHLEFPMWYLKQRGLVETLPSGMFAITIDGIEWLGHDDQAIPDNRLLAKSTGETGSQNGAHADSVTTAAPQGGR